MKGLALSLVLGVSLWLLCHCSAEAQRPAVPGASARNSAQPAIDLERRPLERIPVGTVVGQAPPSGWSNLVLFAIPTLTPEDQRDAPKVAMYYAQLFKLTILANVARRNDGQKPTYYLEKVARGFATTVNGQETVISADKTLGASLGMLGRRILDENEAILDNDVRQVVRTPTMLIFDAKSVVLRKGVHVNMITRHALLVDPDTGRLFTLVWLLDTNYQAAEPAMQLLPEGMWERRLLSVDRRHFTLGIPDREAFALRQIPQGTPIPYTPALRDAATTRSFTLANVPAIETTLRSAAMTAK
jgi:hypothetical protein